MATPLDVLGSRLKCEFTGESGSYSAGVCTDLIGGGTISTNSVGTTTPTTTTTPSGNVAFVFDGVNDYLSGTYGTQNNIAPLAAIPAPGTGQRLIYFIIKVAAISGTLQFIFVTGNQTVIIDSTDQKLTFDSNIGTYGSCTSDVNVGDNNWHRVIIVCDETSAVTRLYIDGSLQSTTLNKLWGQTSEWGGFGTAFSNDTANFLQGTLGRMGFAYTSTTFSTGVGSDIANLDAALQSLTVFAGYSSTATGPSVSLQDQLFDEETAPWFYPGTIFQLDPATGSSPPTPSNLIDPFGCMGFFGV